MGLLDNGDRVSDAELDAKAGDSLAGDFTQGLRSGYQSAKGQLHKLAGTTMNAVGLDGSEQNAKSKVANAYAQVDASELVPFEQADVGRNGMRWLAGALGQSAPISAAITGAGLATGGAGFVPAMLAGTAAGAPFKAGEILQRQEADPANRYASPAQHLANAALPAVASAGVESAIPAFTTMRLAGKTGLSTVGQIAGRTAASVPAEGLSEGAGELALQAGLNQMNPNTGYDWEAIKQNAIQGALLGGALGTVGGIGEVGHKIAGSPGRAMDAVAGLVPDSVKKRLESAKSGLAGATETAGEAADTATEYAKDGFDHTAEAAAKAAEWAKGAISAKTADVRRWGKEFMDDPAAPDSFKAQVQEAVRNPGDKAKAVWLATEKFARDAAAKVSKEADAADIPTKLRALHKTMSDGAGRLRDRLASGGEPADDAEILAAGDDPAKLTEVFDRADKNVLERTQEWAKDLLAEHLSDEQKAKLKTWTDNITDKASVQGIAALHKAQAAGKDLAERASAFAKAARSTPAGKAVEGAIATARTTDAGKAVEGAARSVKDAFTPKRSDTIPEGLREKIGESIMDVLGPYHPALRSKFVRNANGETTVPLQDLADGLRSVIIAASNGEAVSSDALAKLIDVAGPKTRELIDAVHRAVGEPAAGNAAFFQSIEDAVQAGRARESVLAVMQKSLKPELQGAVRTDELQKEAELLRLWLQSNDAKGKLSKPEITHRDEVMRSAIEHRYGDKAEAVLRAVRAGIAKEQKLTEASEGVNPLSSDDDMREDPAGVNTGRREGSARDETVRSHFYADGKKGEELYLAPEHAPPSKFKSPAEQRMVKAKAANPDAQVEFRFVKDLDESDPKVEAMIGAKFDELVETAMLEQGMTEAEAESWANKELDKYGLVVAESSRQETRITDAELAALKMDSKFADSPSRIDSKGPATEENTHPKTKRRTDGNVAFDAVRITEFMNKKMGAAHEYSPTDDKGRRHRDARMFTEGVAALADRLGYSFDIPDSTQITRQGMTWGEVKKLDVRTPKDKAYDAKSQELDRQRASYRSADPTAKANLRQMAEETLQKRADAKDLELSREGFDAPPLDDISTEIANRIARIKELEALRDGLDLTTRAGRAKEKILFMEQAALENVNLRTGFHNVRQEVDPFGPTHDALRGKEEGVPIDANADGSAREDTVMGRRRPAVSNPDATKDTSFTPQKTKDELITEGNHAALQALRNKERATDRKLRAVDKGILRKNMVRKDAAALFHAPNLSPEARAELADRLYKKYIEKADAGEAEAAARGGPPSPKAVAAKKAAFLKKALSGDADLLKTLKASTDAKGLQRAAMALQGKPEAQKALDAINARLSQLVQDEDVAYGLQTKKYSLVGLQIHKDLGRHGFAATHDSPIKHEGKFDWRAHKGKGEGNASFGAGTYLSTSEGVHRSYKEQFTAKADETGAMNELARSRDSYTQAKSNLDSVLAQRDAANWTHDDKGNWYVEGATNSLKLDVVLDGEWGEGFVGVHSEHDVPLTGSFDKLQDLLDSVLDEGSVGPYRDAVTDAKKRLAEAQKEVDENGIGPSPTYEVSVDIPAEQLMDWDKPLSEQSAAVQEALRSLVAELPKPTTKTFKQTGPATFEFDGKPFKLKLNPTGRAYIYPDEAWAAHIGSVSGTGAEAVANAEAYLQAGGREAAKLKNAFNHLADGDARGSDWYRELAKKLHSQSAASEQLQSLGVLGHKYAASGGKNDVHPNYVVYDDSKIHTNYVHFNQQSAQFAAPGQTGPVDRGAVERHIEKVLGPNVGVAWKNILHAGEFTRTATADVISLSMHSLNPMSVAYHESLHGLFARLRDAKQGDIAAVLERAGESAPVLNQLKKLLANEPGALAQLGNAEERAAYMYQFWSQRDANGKRMLNVGEKATGIFQRITQFLREVTGLWTNDERAVRIMEYFHSGEYEKTRSDPNAVHRALMEPGITRPLAKLKAMAEPFTNLGEALVSAGGERLRDSGIPALRQLADAMKLKTTSEGDDPGYLPTSRAEHARRMNQLGADLKPYTEDEIKEATVAMQEGVRAHGKNARIVQRIVQKRLDEALDYMQAAGVNIDHIGAGPKADGVPYFPRSWDASYISAHQKEFLAMADKYVQSGQWKGDPRETMNKLMVTDGAEFNVEVDKPGMQPSKQRVLNFISHADAAPFMRKDLHQIMNNYLLQAARRAEWSRRFGDDGIGVAMMLIAAKAEGATPEQLEMATKFIRAVDGTLGDTLNPTARRMMGNMIVYQNIRLLPLAIFSSIVDPVGLMVRGGTMRDAFNAFKRGVKESVKNFQDDPTGDGMTQLAEAIGTIENASLVHTMGASYGQGMVGDKGRAINDAFFRYNLMDQYNRSMRTSATEAALGFLARHATKPNAHSVRYLRELGLTAADVQLDAEGRPKLFVADGLTEAHSNRMLAAVNRWVDGAVLRPDAVDKALWMSDPHFALVSHLKSFVLSFHETILKRVAHEMRHGNYTPAMALAGYVPVMIAADMVKGLIQGGGEEPPWKAGWGLSDYVWNGVERAGLFGSGQFAIDALTDVTQRGGSGIGALTGPTVEQLTDAVRVLGGNGQFRPFAVKALPANALYAGVLGNESTDPKFVE